MQSVQSREPLQKIAAGLTGIKLYALTRPCIWTGDVLEWRSESALGYAIRLFTGRDVNHTGGALRLNLTAECAERVYTPEATEYGFVLSHLSRQLQGYKGKVYLLRLRSEHDALRDRISAEQMGMIGIAYDFLSLFQNAMGRVNTDMRRLFCSEAIGLSLRRVGLLDEAYMDGKALRPGDFAGAGLFLPRMRIY